MSGMGLLLGCDAGAASPPAGIFSVVSAGGTEKVECAAAAALPASPSAAWTIAFWQKTSTYVSLSQAFGFGQQLPGSSGNHHARYVLQFNNDYYFWGDGADWDTGVAWDSDNAWHHAAFVSDGANISFYRDGALAAGPTALPALATADTFVTAFSRHNSGASSPDMKIAEPAIWATALSGADVASLASGAVDPLSLSPVCYWKLTEGSGTTAADSSGNGNDGTLSGGVTWSSDIPSVL